MRHSNADQQAHLKLCLAAAMTKNMGLQHKMSYTLHFILIEIMQGVYAQFV